MRVRRQAFILVIFMLGLSRNAWAAEQKADPSFMHGIGKTLDGIVFQLPKTIIEGTLAGPPVVGTLMGALGGAARALQTTVAGLAEISAGFDPWGSKRKQ